MHVNCSIKENRKTSAVSLLSAYALIYAPHSQFILSLVGCQIEVSPGSKKASRSLKTRVSLDYSKTFSLKYTLYRHRNSYIGLKKETRR